MSLIARWLRLMTAHIGLIGDNLMTVAASYRQMTAVNSIHPLGGWWADDKFRVEQPLALLVIPHATRFARFSCRAVLIGAAGSLISRRLSTAK